VPLRGLCPKEIGSLSSGWPRGTTAITCTTREERDPRILDRRARTLNTEALDVMEYQARW